MAFSSQDIHKDEIAGRYRIEREIGRGGMATVYLCTDNTTDTQVAVKVLRPELGSAVVVERFLREITFASNLDHPQIPKVLDSGVVGEVPFYVMTYIDGESLRKRLDRVKQLPVEEAVRIAQEVSKPMAYAHASGIVHRDIKPANVFLSGDSVYVLDFGVARAIMASAEDTLTSTGIAVGTPAYMSPEQALADRDLDTRSDIYSLACVTYEMIAGIPPFVGATPQSVMARRFASPPPNLSEIRESVPPAVEEAIRKAMCRAPADRWQTVEEFSRALSGGMTTPSIMAHRVILEQRKRNYAKALISVLAVAILGGSVVTWSLMRRDYVSRGRQALESWDFPAAEASLRKAVTKKPDDPRAQLWLAQLLMLNGAPKEEWQSFALRAADGKAELDQWDQKRSDALAAMIDDSGSDRCAPFESLASERDARHIGDFSASLAYADCLVSDKTVLPDPTSSSGFRFRRSYQQIASLYEALATKNAENPLAFRILMPRLERVLPTDTHTLRMGVDITDAESRFAAWPDLQSDTIAYVPVRLSSAGITVPPDDKSLDRIIATNLARLERLAALWTRNAPSDPDAHEMLARMLEATGKLDGQPESALPHIAKARLVADITTESETGTYRRAVQLGAMQVRVLLKLGRFDDASLLADSVLSWSSPQSDDSATRTAAETLKGLAALTGRLSRLLELEQKNLDEYPVQLPSGEVTSLPNELARDAVALRTYAALGAPPESILVLKDRLAAKLGSVVSASRADAVRAALFSLPLSLAAPSIGVGPAATLPGASGPFIAAFRSVDRGNLRAARAAVDSIASGHNTSAPGAITMDFVLREGWLRAATGDTAGAAQFLDKALGGLSRAPPNLVAHPMLAASLVRTMILRAQLALKTGDAAAAAKWNDAAVSLWRRGDAPMQQLLKGVAGQH